MEHVSELHCLSEMKKSVELFSANLLIFLVSMGLCIYIFFHTFITKAIGILYKNFFLFFLKKNANALYEVSL